MACSECGLPNYSGLCPHCRGDQHAYEREMVPPFPSSLPTEDAAMTHSQTSPKPGEHYIGVGPYGEEEWVKVREVRGPLEHESKTTRVVYDVLSGSEEGRTIAYPVVQFLQEYALDD